MSTPGDDFGDSAGSPKEPSGRIRVSIACQHCRVRKIKCDGSIPCKKCSESGIICQPGAKRKKRAPSRKDQYIRELEKKLQDLQSLGTNSSTTADSPERFEDDAQHGATIRPGHGTSALYRQSTRQPPEIQYFGASCSLSSIDAVAAFAAPSRASTQQLTDDLDAEDLKHPEFLSWSQDHDPETHLRAMRAQLPSGEVIRDYVDKYFALFSPRCPMINEHEFKSRVVAFMRGDADFQLTESFIATLLMVLCVGEYLSAGDGGTDVVSDVPGWRFFLSAYSGAREGLRRANIENMQAVTLQILYLQAISKLSVAYVLLGNLIRVMQAAGMHRAQDLTSPEGISRTNLMNVIYILEKQLALGLGRPSLIQDFDCDFHTPSPPSASLDGTRYTTLALFVHMARIAGDVHRRLYSPEAARSPTQTYLQNIELCEAELERWRSLYLPHLPPGGIFKDESELPPEAFDTVTGDGIRSNVITYMYLLCSVRRAIPVFHTLVDGTKVAGTDPKGVEIAMNVIKILNMDKCPIEPCQWLSIYRIFTCGTILYQSLNAKAALRSQPGSDPEAARGATRQLKALRVLEELFRRKVRGYTGSAQYFSSIVRGWIEQLELTFGPLEISRTATPALPSQRSQSYFEESQPYGGLPMGYPSHTAATTSTGSWSPAAKQHFAHYFNAGSGPLPSPNAPAAAAFSAMYSQELPMLSLTTATTDYQGQYNWVSPNRFAAYGYGLDPPSAVAEHTDFSGAEMFDVGGGYGNFEVGDLMMPAWMPVDSATVAGQQQQQHAQGRY